MTRTLLTTIALMLTACGMEMNFTGVEPENDPGNADGWEDDGSLDTQLNPSEGVLDGSQICALAPDGDGISVTLGQPAIEAHGGLSPGVFIVEELCGDGIDNNCDGQIDEACAVSCPCLDEPLALLDTLDYDDTDATCYVHNDGNELDYTWAFGTVEGDDWMYVQAQSTRWSGDDYTCTAYWRWTTADGGGDSDGAEFAIDAWEHELCEAEIEDLTAEFGGSCRYVL